VVEGGTGELNKTKMESCAIEEVIAIGDLISRGYIIDGWIDCKSKKDK
jgi:hypothetical protein